MAMNGRWLLFALFSMSAFASDLVEGEFKSNLVPNLVLYAVLPPDGGAGIPGAMSESAGAGSGGGQCSEDDYRSSEEEARD